MDTQRMFHEWMNKKIKWGYKGQDREITKANLTNKVTFKSPLDMVPKWWTQNSLYQTFKKYTLPSFAEEFFLKILSRSEMNPESFPQEMLTLNQLGLRTKAVLLKLNLFQDTNATNSHEKQQSS